ncbi:hypothetical protein [Oerskovia enterophila]|uniref:Uncharacterized protein n=1 Tax=Oerskovia enterophila TaxID=43678 RepID=A0ABX2Y8C4_9CELL|nr:hypothetical protein [Oerskovia enterophila]OCI32848.1 hypothetical protein OERS_04400 [Oerskovia enterophila]
MSSAWLVAGTADVRAEHAAATARAAQWAQVSAAEQAWITEQQVAAQALASRSIHGQRVQDILARANQAITAAQTALDTSPNADPATRDALAAAIPVVQERSDQIDRGVLIQDVALALDDLTLVAQVVTDPQATWQAEQDRIAAEAAEAERVRAAEAQRAKTATTPKKAPATTNAPAPAPAPAPAAPAAPAGQSFAWKTSVSNSGDQSVLDRCAGGLTRWFEDIEGKPYYPIHRHCGGSPILKFSMGDRVQIDGQAWVVTDSRNLHAGDDKDLAFGLNGQILVQTCFVGTNGAVSVVALTRG